MGLAPVRTASLSWATKSWRRRRRAGRAEPLQVRAKAGGGRRGRCAALGGRDARVVGARTPAAEKPGRCTARQSEAPPPLASLAPPLPPAAKSPKEKVEEAVEAPQVTGLMHPKRYPKQFKAKQGSF